MFRNKNLSIILLGLGLALCLGVLTGGVTVIPSEGRGREMWGIEGSSKCGGRVFNSRDSSIPLRSTQNDARRRLQQIYTAEIGVREATGHNDGTRVQEYLQYVHLKGNFSYCAAFTCWALGKAGINNPKNGWAPAMFPEKRVVWKGGKHNDAINRVFTGDVFGIYFSNLKRIGHCGFVDSWDRTWCITVEANTTDIRAGPGEGVFKKKRLVKTIYKVADWVN
ncbi:hypothetical protein SAMN05216436_11153 [bacterium A37T11]|nr:hypothetical protein SAMN05216436_11153 [bacterium A37T11]